MLEKWEKSVDMGKTFATLLTEFLIDLTNAKFNVYGFISSSARLIHIIFPIKNKDLKYTQFLVPCKKFFLVSHRVFILGPILFNIFACGLFSAVSNTDFASYADDNNTMEVIDALKNHSKNYCNGTA